MPRHMYRVVVVAALAVLSWTATAQAASLTLKWDASSGAAGYILYVGTKSGVYTTSTNVGNKTQFIASSLTGATRYYFAVQAYGANGLKSSLSAEVSGLTPADPPAPTPFAPAPPAIRPAANLGFTGSGTPALVWESASGSLKAWFLNGVTATSDVAFTPGSTGDANWRLAGAADFNNDGWPDLLFQHSTSGALCVWFMKGTKMVSWSMLTPDAPADAHWKVIGIADFNRDGRPDLAFQHSLTGVLALWYMSGTTWTNAVLVTPNTPGDMNWQVVGVGDFDRDGYPDLVFQHALTGGVVIWYMNGAQMKKFAVVAALPSEAAWKVVAVADLNGDAKPDLVFRHTVTATPAVWFMNGAALSSAKYFTPVGAWDPAWTITAVR